QDAPRRDRSPRPANSERSPRLVREPLRRIRHDGQRGRVGRQREGQGEGEALRERPQGRLLGAGARPVPPDDDGPKQVAPGLPDGVPLRRRPDEHAPGDPGDTRWAGRNVTGRAQRFSARASKCSAYTNVVSCEPWAVAGSLACRYTPRTHRVTSTSG